MTALDRVNYLNVGLMIVSCVAAFTLPFELFLASYAILGPLHYLTEISWLHDRGFFARGHRDFLWLVGLVLLIELPRTIGYSPVIPGSGGVLVALLFAAGMALLPTAALRFGSYIAAIVFVVAWGKGSFTSAIFGLWLPTLIHVYVFTWIFVLYGSLKQRSDSGFVSLAVLTALGLLCLFVPGSERTLHLSRYVADNVSAFGELHLDLAEALGWPTTIPNATAAMRFIAFAYTYHYLNWFSKTKIIRWHEVSHLRLAGVSALYLASVALYAYDYRVGLRALGLLSLGHVLLEFPLNVRSLVGIATELRGSGRPKAPLRRAA